jgi:hypothetical protein
MVPTADQVIDDQFSTGGPNYREFLYSLVNITGQAQNYDGNGPYLRVQGGGGPNLVGETNLNPNQRSEKSQFAHTIAAPIGTQPQVGDQAPLKPEVRCYTNPVPDLNSGLGEVGAPSPQAVSAE